MSRFVKLIMYKRKHNNSILKTCRGPPGSGGKPRLGGHGPGASPRKAPVGAGGGVYGFPHACRAAPESAASPPPPARSGGAGSALQGGTSDLNGTPTGWSGRPREAHRRRGLADVPAYGLEGCPFPGRRVRAKQMADTTWESWESCHARDQAADPPLWRRGVRSPPHTLELPRHAVRARNQT